MSPKEKPLTNAAFDNIDHNPSSTTAKDSFHETGFQHPQFDISGLDRPTDEALTNISASKILLKLPQSYIDVPPVTLCKKDPVPPKVEAPNKPDSVLIPEAMKTEYR